MFFKRKIKEITIPDAEEFRKKHNLKPDPEEWEDGIRISTAPGNFEWWYFDASFDDGSTCVVVFYTKPLLDRRGPLKPSIQLNITRPDGTRLKKMPVFPREQFSALKKSCDVKIAENWVKGDLKTYTLHAESGGLAADLTFKSLVPARRAGPGLNYYEMKGEKEKYYFAWFPPVPHGTVEGTLTYDGITRQVKGTGYHDHNWGNLGVPLVMSHWYWGRAVVGDYLLIFAQMYALPSYGSREIPVFILGKGQELLVGESALKLEISDIVRHPGGREYPEKLSLKWESGGESVEAVITGPKIIEARSMLDLVPPVKRKIARLFANPYYFRFEGDIELVINMDKVKDNVKGKSLYEIMYLRGRR